MGRGSGLCVNFISSYFFDASPNVPPFGLKNTLQSEGFDDDAALEDAIKKLEADLRKARKKDDDTVDEIVVRFFMFLAHVVQLDGNHLIIGGTIVPFDRHPRCGCQYSLLC